MQTYGTRSLFILVAFAAVACWWLKYRTVTLRCDYGQVDIIGGFLAPGERMDIYGRTRGSKFKLLVPNALIVGEPRWEHNGTSVHVVDVRIHISKTGKLRDQFDYRVRFPDSAYAADPLFDD